MILQALYDLYDRLVQDDRYAVAGLGYSRQNIAFRIVLNEDGSLFDIQQLRDKETGRAVPMIVPGGDKPTGGVTEKSVHKKVNLLRNDLPFLLGLDVGDDQKPTPSPMQFEAFKKFHLKLRPEIRDEEFEIVCRFLESWEPERAVEEHPDWAKYADGQGVFQIRGCTHYVHERPAVRSWQDSQQASTSKSSDYVAQCLITGEKLPVARLHEPKIKKVMGSQTAGAPIVSFDKDSDAFASYGRDGDQGFNAPVSKLAAFRYATALNALTEGPMNHKHRFTLGDATVVFWTKEPTNTEDIFAQFATGGLTVAEGAKEAQDESVRQKIELFLKALRKGREAFAELDGKADQTPFYLLGLTGQARGRIGVRFFYTDRLSTLLENLHRHYHDMEMVPWAGFGEHRWRTSEFPKLWEMVAQTVPASSKRDERDKQSGLLIGPLLRAVITGGRYPANLFSGVMRRIHADREVNYVRACVIAGHLRRNLKQEVSMSLDTERKDPAYRLGRLFAVLEMVQVKAIEGSNATIRDRFYGAASATPGVVFSRLLRTYQHHLAKLETGGKIHFERLAQEILAPVKEFPPHLGLAEQGLFALGYYHQAKDLWTSKANKETEKGE